MKNDKICSNEYALNCGCNYEVLEGGNRFNCGLTLCRMCQHELHKSFSQRITFYLK